MLNDYRVLKKTEIEKARDNIICSINNSIFDTLGLNKMYRQGQIIIIESLLNCLQSSTSTLTKDDLIVVLEEFKKESDINKDKNTLTYIDALINQYK